MQSFVDAANWALSGAWEYVSSANFLYSPVYLISAALIAYVVWRRKGNQTGFWRHLFPREYYRHPSTRVDIQVTILNLFIFGSGILSVFFFGPLVAYGASGRPGVSGGAAPSPGERRWRVVSPLR